MERAVGAMPWSVGGEIALAIYVFPLVMAAVSDLHSLRIPNWLTGSLALAFFVVAFIFGHNVNWLSHVAAGLGVFVVAAVLFGFGFMGGGDAKLMAATALWTGLNELVPFLYLMALIGGGFAVVVMLLRHPVVQTSFLATLRRVPTFAQKNMPIPYGIPIAIAGILVAPSLAYLA